MDLPRLWCLVSAGDELSLLAELAAAGVDGFQVRDKDATTRELVQLTRIVLAAVRPAGATVVVDDRLDVALAAGADGVHLGADDLAVVDARRLAPDAVVGATCRDGDAVAAAAVAGATYAGFGPVFETSSKAGLPAPLGTGAVAAAGARLPLIAIGGMDAVIGAIWRRPDPVAAAKELLAAVQ